MPMALRPNSVTAKNKRRQPATCSQKRIPIKKSTPTQRAGTRRSARLQHTPPASDVQASTTSPAPISQPARTKRKCPQDADELEDVRPSKQLKELPTPELSEVNLRLFNKDMDASTSSSRPGSIKRSSSQRSVSTTQATKTSSSSTNHHYRLEVLRPRQINIHPLRLQSISMTLSAPLSMPNPPRGAESNSNP